MQNIRDIERMTLYEYEIRRVAHQVAYVDKLRDLHDQAWLNQQIKATKKDGKPHFKDKKSFFDYEKQLNLVLGIEKPEPVKADETFLKLMRKANL